MRGRRHVLCRGAAVACLGLLLAACESGVVGLDAGSLGIRQSSAPPALASATMFTSPDGGIYKNPDHLEVLLASRADVGAVERQLGSAASSWAALHRLGKFTLVAMRLRDDGKVTSEPRLNTLQMASDYAPAGTSAGPLRHFYHPTYPLALVSSTQPGDECSVHLDPGSAVLAILVYPPVDLAAQMVWGSYGDFVLTIPTGGAVPPLAGSLHVVACAVPPSQSTPP